MYKRRLYILWGRGFPGGTRDKESDTGDTGSIPWLGRSPGVGILAILSILAWKIPWAEEPGGQQSMKSQRVEYN